MTYTNAERTKPKSPSGVLGLLVLFSRKDDRWLFQRDVGSVAIGAALPRPAGVVAGVEACSLTLVYVVEPVAGNSY